MFLENRDILSVRYLCFPFGWTGARQRWLLGPCSLLKNVKEPGRAPLPASDPVPVLQRSGRVCGGGHGDPG